MESSGPKDDDKKTQDAESLKGEKAWEKVGDIPKRFDELSPEPDWIPVADVIRNQREAEAKAEEKKIKIKPPSDSAFANSDSKSVNQEIPKKQITVHLFKKEAKKGGENKAVNQTKPSKEKENQKPKNLDKEETTEDLDAVTKSMMAWALKTDYDPRKRIGRRSSLPAVSSKDFSKQAFAQSEMRSTEEPADIQKHWLKKTKSTFSAHYEQDEDYLHAKGSHEYEHQQSGPHSHSHHHRRASTPAVSTGYSSQQHVTSPKYPEFDYVLHERENENRTPSPDYESDELRSYDKYEQGRYYEDDWQESGLGYGDHSHHPDHDYHRDPDYDDCYQSQVHDYRHHPHHHFSSDYDDRYYTSHPRYDDAQSRGTDTEYYDHYSEQEYRKQHYNYPNPRYDDDHHGYDPDYGHHHHDRGPNNKYDRY